MYSYIWDSLYYKFFIMQGLPTKDKTLETTVLNLLSPFSYIHDFPEVVNHLVHN